VGTKGGELRVTDAEVALASAVVNVRAAIEDSGAVIRHSPLPTVYADPSNLSRCSRTCLGNAIKFRDSRPPEIGVACEDAPEEWCFSVCDNGIGIDRSMRIGFFQVFQRLHTRKDYPGTGIALRSARKSRSVTGAGSGWRRSPAKAPHSILRFTRTENTYGDGPGGEID